VLFRKDDDLIVRKQERMQWLIKTEEALKAERIRLRGQLIKPIDPEAGFSPHYEVLLSVFDEQGAPLNLGEFIATAEAFNRMSEVDRLVIRKALQWVRDNTRQARAMGGIAINLSGQSMADAGLVAFIRQQMSDFKIPSELVSFEVTETSAIASLDQAVAIIEEFKAMGCHMAIDDFGTGMSSYTYLKQLPVDYLKIDGSFIKDMLNNPRDQAIVKSVNEIAHFMGMRTIAEYVENLEILDRLGEIGVDYAQGYALEKPRFLDEIP
jgi:EAL domain-containing protein (putative c-di-GMP-specific phosphodiesterase class I)